jgi:hypothetical protein
MISQPNVAQKSEEKDGSNKRRTTRDDTDDPKTKFGYEVALIITGQL